MADLLEQNAQEDERGRRLAENSTPHVRPHGAALSSDEQAKRDQIENGEAAGEPNYVEQLGGSSGGQSSSNAESSAGGAADRLRSGLGQAGQLIGRNKKKLGIGGSISALLIAAIFAFLSILPLKLESFIKNIYNHEFGRSENYVEKRVDRVVYRYIYEKATGTILTDPLYTSGSPIKDLFVNWDQSRQLDKLEQKTGLKFSSPKRGQVEVKLADGSSTTVNSDAELYKYLDQGPLKGQEARDAIRAYARDTTKWYQYLKRLHIRRWMRKSLGIHRFGLPKRTDKEASSTDVNAQSPTQQDLAEGTTETIDQTEGEVLTAMTDGQDNLGNDERQFVDGAKVGVAPEVVDGNTDNSTEGKGAVTDEVKADTTAISDAGKKATKSALKDGIDKILQDAAVKAITASLSKAIPVAGWVALASDFDNFMWNGHIRNATILMHSAQYASVFATFAGTADQLKNGDLSGQQVNDVMTQIANIEKSNAFQRIYMHQDTGVKMDPSKGVNNSINNTLIQPSKWPTCDVTDVLSLGNNGTAPTNMGSADFWTYTYRQFASSPASPVHVPLCQIHPVVKAFNGIIGQVVGGLLDISTSLARGAIDFIGGLFGQHHVTKAVMQAATTAASKGMIWTMTKVFVPAATGREMDASLGNAIDAGGDVSAQGYGRDTLGEKAISDTDAAGQQAMLDAEQRQTLNNQGMIASLFNMDFTQSFASRFTAMLPATPTDAANRAGQTAIAAIANPVKFFSHLSLSFIPGSSAQVPPADPYGVQQYGYDESDLDQALQLPTQDIAGPPDSSGHLSLPDGKIDEYDCPQQTNPRVTNICLMDVAAVEDLNAQNNPSSVDGSQP